MEYHWDASEQSPAPQPVVVCTPPFVMLAADLGHLYSYAAFSHCVILVLLSHDNRCFFMSDGSAVLAPYRGIPPSCRCGFVPGAGRTERGDV